LGPFLTFRFPFLRVLQQAFPPTLMPIAGSAFARATDRLSAACALFSGLRASLCRWGLCKVMRILL
jgi:hypothetical protein